MKGISNVAKVAAIGAASTLLTANAALASAGRSDAVQSSVAEPHPRPIWAARYDGPIHGFDSAILDAVRQGGRGQDDQVRQACSVHSRHGQQPQRDLRPGSLRRSGEDGGVAAGVDGQVAQPPPSVCVSRADIEPLWTSASSGAARGASQRSPDGLQYEGHFEDGAEAGRRALAIEGTTDHVRANILHNLGGLEHARGNLVAPQSFAHRGLELRARVAGWSDPRTIGDRAALGAILAGLGRFDEAEALSRSALELQDAAEGSESLDVAVALNNLADLASRRGDDAEAERSYRRALSIKERVTGKRHPSVATTLNNLAVVLRRSGRQGEAASMYRRAIAILERSLAEDHPNLVACRQNLAACETQVVVQGGGGFVPWTR